MRAKRLAERVRFSKASAQSFDALRNWYELLEATVLRHSLHPDGEPAGFYLLGPAHVPRVPRRLSYGGASVSVYYTLATTAQAAAQVLYTPYATS